MCVHCKIFSCLFCTFKNLHNVRKKWLSSLISLQCEFSAPVSGHLNILEESNQYELKSLLRWAFSNTYQSFHLTLGISYFPRYSQSFPSLSVNNFVFQVIVTKKAEDIRHVLTQCPQTWIFTLADLSASPTPPTAFSSCLPIHFWILFLISSLLASSPQFVNSRYIFPILKHAYLTPCSLPALFFLMYQKAQTVLQTQILHFLISPLSFNALQCTFLPGHLLPLILQFTPSVSHGPLSGLHKLLLRVASYVSFMYSQFCNPQCSINSPLLLPPYAFSWGISLTVTNSTTTYMLMFPNPSFLSSDVDSYYHCLLDFLIKVSSKL